MSDKAQSTADERLEERVQAFERAWRRGSPPEISRFLSDSGDDARRLHELIAVDLECRWRAAQTTGGVVRGSTLERYVKAFPQLGALDDLPAWLVVEEYRARHRWGDRPPHGEFLARFPRHGVALQQLLARVDDEIRREGIEAETIATLVKQTFVPVPVDPEAPLYHGDFFLRRLIGAGGHCKVYTGIQRSLAKPVAVKVLKKAAAGDPSLVRRFLQEARIAAALHRPGIVGVQGLGRLPDGGYFMVMELIEGQDLSRLVRHGPRPPREAAILVQQAASLMSHVHTNGVLHCDLKPSNLLLNSRGVVHVTDFGLARYVGEQRSDEKPLTYIAGTAAYMAPEQIQRARGPISEATDVYGLGGVLYTLLTGAAPFAGHDRDETMRRVLCDSVPPIGFVVAEDRRLESICRRCLEKDPRLRFASAEELAVALQQLRADSTNP